MAHPLAGQKAPASLLIDPAALLARYREEHPDPTHPAELVSFGTSGHRGSSLRQSFNDDHIAAVVQAVCEHRARVGITGPLFMGRDSHALSAPAQQTALEVLAANGVTVFIAQGDELTPTPVISHAILRHNRGRTDGLADGLVITPSHNPPEDGGIKYNPPDGGPADTDVTSLIEKRANDLLRARLDGVKRTSLSAAIAASTTVQHDYITPYVDDLEHVIDMAAIARAGIKIGADPLGGSNVAYWAPIARRYGLSIEVTSTVVDPTFSFMPVDHDGKIRMDCSSPHAMANLVALRDRFDIAFGNDPDSDRHGIVTRSAGLMNPNHYLAVAVDHLFTHRSFAPQVAVGKTLVTSSLVDRVARALGRNVVEVPVGFKYFVKGLVSGTLGFGGEESAGASFLRRDGTVWTTDKDGILLDLLAAEILAVTGNDPSAHYDRLTAQLGAPRYVRLDAPATSAQKAALKKLSPDSVKASTLAGDPITEKLTRAPGNGESIGGLKVVTEQGWFAARPSGTEDVYKIYAESFKDEAHLAQIIDEARAIVASALGG